jgi:hypothetical protein
MAWSIYVRDMVYVLNNSINNKTLQENNNRYWVFDLINQFIITKKPKTHSKIYLK